MPETTANPAARVVLEILVHGPMPRAELAARLELSGPSLTRITKPLIDAGVLLEGASVPTDGGGRPSIPLDIDPSAHHFVGAKLTATGLFVVVTDRRGTVLREFDEPLTETRVEAVVAQVAEAAARLAADDTRIRGIGVSLGGTVSHRARVVEAPFLGWADVDLAERLKAATGLPTRVENDVRALAQAELWFGAGRGRDSFALVTVGAGVGLGLVVGGRVVDGARSRAGAVEHLVIGGDRVCPAGHAGCAAAYLTTAADAPADEAAAALGRLVVAVTRLVDPEVVLVSGESVGIAVDGAAALEAALADAVDVDGTRPAVELRPFRFSEWARGAAAVAIQEHALGL